jgi:hypothetical protein
MARRGSTFWLLKKYKRSANPKKNPLKGFKRPKNLPPGVAFRWGNYVTTIFLRWFVKGREGEKSWR